MESFDRPSTQWRDAIGGEHEEAMRVEASAALGRIHLKAAHETAHRRVTSPAVPSKVTRRPTLCGLLRKSLLPQMGARM